MGIWNKRMPPVVWRNDSFRGNVICPLQGLVGKVAAYCRVVHPTYHDGAVWFLGKLLKVKAQ